MTSLLISLFFVPLTANDACAVGRRAFLKTMAGTSFEGLVSGESNTNEIVIHSKGATGSVIHIIPRTSILSFELTTAVQQTQAQPIAGRRSPSQDAEGQHAGGQQAHSQPVSSAQLALELIFD